jgi:AcrR family transcriptional regulator
MASHSTAPLRRVPRQVRGQRRVAGFLRAAASVITEFGYDRTTMSAIAERASSSIGSLYQFFPNKQSVVEALRSQYIKEIEKSWIALEQRAAAMTAHQLADRLVGLHIEIVQNHPALLALMDVPPTSCTPARRELIRARIVSVLLAHNPHLSKLSASRVASVVQEISKGLLVLYAKSEPKAKSAIVEEFKSVLSGYLVLKLKR